MYMSMKIFSNRELLTVHCIPLLVVIILIENARFVSHRSNLAFNGSSLDEIMTDSTYRAGDAQSSGENLTPPRHIDDVPLILL